jgi:hypothetical protein
MENGVTVPAAEVEKSTTQVSLTLRSDSGAESSKLVVCVINNGPAAVEVTSLSLCSRTMIGRLAKAAPRQIDGLVWHGAGGTPIALPSAVEPGVTFEAHVKAADVALTIGAEAANYQSLGVIPDNVELVARVTLDSGKTEQAWLCLFQFRDYMPPGWVHPCREDDLLCAICGKPDPQPVLREGFVLASTSGGGGLMSRTAVATMTLGACAVCVARYRRLCRILGGLSSTALALMSVTVVWYAVHANAPILLLLAALFAAGAVYGAFGVLFPTTFWRPRYTTLKTRAAVKLCARYGIRTRNPQTEGTGFDVVPLEEWKRQAKKSLI